MSDTTASKVKLPQGGSSSRLGSATGGQGGSADYDAAGGSGSSVSQVFLGDDSSGVSAGASTVPDDLRLEGEVSPSDLTVISDRRPDSTSETRVRTSAELGPLLVGQRLGHFELEEFIGGGGMGAVFRGTDTMLGRTVAIKVLSRQHADDEETTRRFRNEAQSAARLDHENIARVYFVGVDRGWHYIVLEYIDGQNVRDLVLRGGALPLADVINYTARVAAALAHASSRDVVHRDIKPSNVLVTSDQRLKLVDMGLARLHQVEHSSEDITASGVTLGTFDYISPEQARDPRAADVRSDLYSLGCTMYFMLCGQPPFPEGTVLQKLLQHQGDEAPDPRMLRPDVPEELVAILRKLLAKSPQQRYQTPDDLIAELMGLAEQLGLPATGVRVDTWIEPRAQRSNWAERHLPWLVPSALLLVVVLAIQLTGSGSKETPGDPAEPPRKTSTAKNEGTSKAGHAAHHDKRPRNANTPERVAAKSNSAKSSRDEGNSERPAKTSPSDTAVAKAGKSNKATAGALYLPPSLDATADRNALASQDTILNSVDGFKAAAAGTKPKGLSGSPPTGIKGAPPLGNDPRVVGQDIKPQVVAPNPGGSIDSKAAVIAVTPEGRQEYVSLAEACRLAPSGSIIELRYNGRRDERPIQLANHELTIRAGEGFHPIVRFRPEGSDPLIYPRAMITVAGGDLTLVNVELEMEIPRLVRTDRWMLIETVLADKLRLERCTLTILNAGEDAAAYQEDVSFFSVKAAPRRETGMMTEPAMADGPLSIELRDCIVRGEATLLTGNALHTVSLQWENGLLATSERLLSVSGGQEAIPATRQVQLDLQHVTALMRGGLCSVTTREDERIVPNVRINCTDCILLTDNTPLVEQRGVDPVDEQQKCINWKGNRNFYEGFDVFWHIDGPQATVPTELSWSAWRDFWGPGRETTQRIGSALFKQLPDRRRFVSTYTPADFALDATASTNPARGAATDGTTDVGLKAELLPSLNKEAAPAETGDPSGESSVEKNPKKEAPAEPTDPSDPESDSP